MSFELLAVVGPTASGKSSLAIEIAKAIPNHLEIVNGDAMQLYKHLDIGTAKLSVEDRGGVPHHLFDVITPSQEMTAVEYQGLARQAFREISAAGGMPILTGGSMFYISAALDNLGFAPTDLEIRTALEAEAEQFGPGLLFDRLQQLDPLTASRIPKQNIRRVIRALEVIQITGEPYSSALPEQSFFTPTLMLGIRTPREVLRERIAARVNQMWESGLLEEARWLRENWVLSRTAAKAIGYQQAFQQLDGELSQQQAIEQTVNLTNRYARRQMSWFGRDKRIVWLDDDQNLVANALERIRLEQ